ncbi:MAG: F0F1 ATP synthase subunit A, partial [Actinobacteria bacterium]|nr:F0F1 ATP synthase subunit A [Actinomycetota bacterium]
MIINSILSFEFPPINELLRWKDVVPGLNKVGMIAVAAAVIGTLLFLSAARKDPKVAPKGTRNLAEVCVEFIENNIIMQTMGRDGLGWTPFLLTLFLFVYLCNM